MKLLNRVRSFVRPYVSEVKLNVATVGVEVVIETIRRVTGSEHAGLALVTPVAMLIPDFETSMFAVAAVREHARALLAAEEKDRIHLDDPNICDHCRAHKPVCVGAYDGHAWAYACPKCCQHGGEDGQCIMLSDLPDEIARLKLAQVNLVEERDSVTADAAERGALLQRMGELSKVLETGPNTPDPMRGSSIRPTISFDYPGNPDRTHIYGARLRMKQTGLDAGRWVVSGWSRKNGRYEDFLVELISKEDTEVR